ncbi:conserved hypothetical protein [Candidatus Sulfopaludibacter sp. SbA4]|nr:conserved hypothetical protein [Candidatus Sulfopaludibacter sp. SbA4]
MQKDDLVYVGHMLDMSRKALELAKGKSREDFDRDEALSIALTHLLQVVGEAARRISRSFTEEHPEIPWRAIVGMRNKVVHDYLYVDEDVVWDVITGDLEPLVASLAKLF